MKRKDFIRLLAGSPALRAFPAKGSARITSLTFTSIEGRFHKFVAMNSHSTRPGGQTYTNTLVRVGTDRGLEGLEVMDYSKPDPDFLRAVKALVGTDPLSLYEMKNGRIVGRAPSYAALLSKYMHLDGPLFDLVGKLTGAPCWKLIGDAARQQVEVYDGTLYFSDIWFRDRGVRAVMEEVEESLRKGYVGMKFKVGRGWKWMEMNAGIQRDIDIVRAVRKAAGPKLKILTDANNAYQENFEGAWRFLNETQDLNLHWIEEAFPESVEGYTRLKNLMEKAGMKTLIADGENFRDPRAFRTYLQPRRLMDVLQLDVRRGGFLGCLEMAQLGEPAGALSIPHNWASQVGVLMGLQLSKAAPSVAAAEDDRSTCDAIITEKYLFKNGFYTVPEVPGLGIELNEAVYRGAIGARYTLPILPLRRRATWLSGRSHSFTSKKQAQCKSIDGGTTWNAVNSGLIDKHISFLAVDPQNTGTVYAASIAGVFKTTNGGAAWNWVWVSGGGVDSLAIDPQNPGTIYADITGYVYKSRDAGTTWNAINSGLPNGCGGGSAPKLTSVIDPQTRADSPRPLSSFPWGPESVVRVGYRG